MIRPFSALCFLPLILLSQSAHACQCLLALSSCNEVGASDLVFIGTVVTIEPIFLSRWNLTGPASMRALNEDYNTALQHPSDAAVARVRDSYLKTFPDLSADDKSRANAAKTLSDVTALFYSSLSRGMSVRLRVKTVFKHQDDDDSPGDSAAKDSKAPAGKGKAATDDDDDDKKKGPTKQAVVKTAGAAKGADADDDKGKKGDEEFFEIETPFGDCGFDFQEGETYLVYATSDEDSDVLSTSSCSRTRRLSDAGDDLTYLYFYQNRPEESARLDGFVTTDTLFQTNLDRMHDPASVKSPVPGVMVELQSGQMVRYAETDDKGRFVFDGLSEGDYTVSAYAHGYPVENHLLAQPQPIRIAKKSCARQMILLPKKE